LMAGGGIACLAHPTENSLQKPRPGGVGPMCMARIGTIAIRKYISIQKALRKKRMLISPPWIGVNKLLTAYLVFSFLLISLNAARISVFP